MEAGYVVALGQWFCGWCASTDGLGPREDVLRVVVIVERGVRVVFSMFEGRWCGL